MSPKPIDLVCRLCLITAVLLVLYAATQILVLLVAGLIVALAWRAHHQRPPLSGAYGRARWCSFSEADKASMFSRRGFFLGRFAGPGPDRLKTLLELFTLPLHRSAQAVRQCLDLFRR